MNICILFYGRSDLSNIQMEKPQFLIRKSYKQFGSTFECHFTLVQINSTMNLMLFDKLTRVHKTV